MDLKKNLVVCNMVKTGRPKGSTKQSHKVTITATIDEVVADRLKEEDNKSEVVNLALKKHYKIK